MSSKDPAKVRAASKRFYDKNPEYYRERNRIQRERKAAYIRTKREVPCFDCGVQYPYYIMEFDHREEKAYNIAQMNSQSRKRVDAELAKCDVVCANCHCKRTHDRRTSASGGKGYTTE